MKFRIEHEEPSKIAPFGIPAGTWDGAGIFAVDLVDDSFGDEAIARLFGTKYNIASGGLIYWDAIKLEKLPVICVKGDSREYLSGFWGDLNNEITLGGSLSNRNTDVRDLMESLDVIELIKRDPMSLSTGESLRALICALAAGPPCLIVLDGVTSGLDRIWRSKLGNTWRRIDSQGEHPLLILGGHDGIGCVCVIDMVHGQVNVTEAGSFSDSELPRSVLTETDSVQPNRKKAKVSAEVAVVNRPHIRRGTRVLPLDVHFSLSAGDVTWLIGKNGSGKTSVLEALLKWHSCETGVCSIRVPSQMVGYSAANGDDLVTETTLLDEVTLWLDSEQKTRTINLFKEAGLHKDDELSTLADNRSRRKLASVFAAIVDGKELCLLDEPGLGLSSRHQLIVAKAIAIRQKEGTAFVISSHDVGFREKVLSLSGELVT